MPWYGVEKFAGFDHQKNEKSETLASSILLLQIDVETWKICAQCIVNEAKWKKKNKQTNILSNMSIICTQVTNKLRNIFQSLF